MLPEAFLKRIQRMLGDEYEEFLDSFGQKRCQALRLNPLKIGAEGKKAGKGLTLPFARLAPVPWAEDGYYYEAEDQPGKHPFHEAGLYYIQEPSAMAPAELLEARPGHRALDLCAAPGGKSTQLASKLRGAGFLICNEIHPARAKILSENIERMGIENACVTNETPARLAERFPGFFDRILVDAPCSGEGMFRKNQEACQEWSPENVRLCAERQDEILNCAAEMLRPGGRLVYSTCTFSVEEDEGSILRFLERHPEFAVVPIDKAKFGIREGRDDGWRARCLGEEGSARVRGTLRLWPHEVKGEGHFAAVLEKAGGGSDQSKSDQKASEREPEEYLQFCRENLRVIPGCAGLTPECEKNFAERGEADPPTGGCVPDKFRYVRFGENLYLVPADLPDMKGLKVLRPGLHLGEIKKNRFEPSHALALALSPDNAVHVWNFREDDPTVMSYLNGQTFQAEGEKGWYLICVEGFSLGWGKLAGGVMKNHYPRGLRK